MAPASQTKSCRTADESNSSHFGTWSFRPLVKWHLVKSAPVDSRFDIYRVCIIIISQNNNDGLGVGFIVFLSTCTLQQQRFPKETHHMLIMRHVFNLTTSNYLFKQGFIL
jgi:hypothetical protein